MGTAGWRIIWKKIIIIIIIIIMIIVITIIMPLFNEGNTK